MVNYKEVEDPILEEAPFQDAIMAVDKEVGVGSLEMEDPDNLEEVVTSILNRVMN